MELVLTLGGRRETPIPPDISEAVEMWARQRGRHARMEWNPHLGCAAIHFRAAGISEGFADGPVIHADRTESVALHEWDPTRGHYVPLNLAEYGAQGIVALLEKADTYSGRGEHNSLQESIEAVQRRNAALRESQLKAGEEAGREMAWLHRRSVLGTPVVPGANFNQEQ